MNVTDVVAPQQKNCLLQQLISCEVYR